MIAIDTETHLFESQGDEKINFRPFIPPDMVCLTWATEDEEGLVMWDDEQSLIDILFHARPIVMHNAAFDCGVLSNLCPKLQEILQDAVDKGQVLDTRVMYLLRYPDAPVRSASLRELARDFAGIELDKGGTRTSFRRGQPLSQKQIEYATLDARATYDVGRTLLSKCMGEYRSFATRQFFPQGDPYGSVDGPTAADRNYSSAAANLAWNLAPVGMRVDHDSLSRVHATLDAALGDCKQRLDSHELGYYSKEPGSIGSPVPGYAGDAPRKWTYQDGAMYRTWKGEVQRAPAVFKVRTKEVREIAETWAEKNKVTLPRSPKTKAISLKRDDYKDHMASLPEPLADFMEYEKYKKYVSAFTQPLINCGAERVYPNYFIPGAVTGRWSCRRPNLQQVPKKFNVRSIYRPSDGFKFVTADYPTLELYTLAQTMVAMGIKGPLLETLWSKADIHTRTAAMLFDKEEAEVTKDERFAAKACNFGLPGGMGARRFHAHARSLGLDWSYDDARATRFRWFEAYPDIWEYIGRLTVRVWEDLYPDVRERSKFVRRLGLDPQDSRDFDIIQKLNNGRIFTVKLATGRVLPDRTYAAAANAPFQGLGADIITHCFNELCSFGARVCSVVHDSVMLEVLEDDCDFWGQVLIDCMCEALRQVCPDLPVPEIEVEVLDAWG